MRGRGIQKDSGSPQGWSGAVTQVTSLDTHTHSREVTLVILAPQTLSCNAQGPCLRDFNTGLLTQVSVPFGVSSRQEHRVLPIYEGP